RPQPACPEQGRVCVRRGGADRGRASPADPAAHPGDLLGTAHCRDQYPLRISAASAAARAAGPGPVRRRPDPRGANPDSQRIHADRRERPGMTRLAAIAGLIAPLMLLATVTL